VSDQSHTNVLTITFTQFTHKIPSTAVYILQASHSVQQSQHKHSTNQCRTVSSRSAVRVSVQSDCQQHTALHTVQLFWQTDCQIVGDVRHSSGGTVISACVVCVRCGCAGNCVCWNRERGETAQCCTVLHSVAQCCTVLHSVAQYSALNY